MRPEVRWNNGNGYKKNKKFYKDILYYGWEDGFSHEVLKDGLTSYQARELEHDLIKKYNSLDEGYNNICDIPYSFGSDIFEFPIINNTDFKYEVESSHFTKIPNDFIQCNIRKKFQLDRTFLITYILIDRNKNYENISLVSIGSILRKCGFHGSLRKSKCFFEVVKSIIFLKRNNYIDCDFDPYSIRYEDIIEIKIIKENFDCKSNFTKIQWNIFDDIMNIKTTMDNHNLFFVFLYMTSFMIVKKTSDDKQIRSAFYRNISQMATEIGMSKETLINSLNLLIEEKILIKRIVGSIKQSDKPPQNVPNIYVLNQPGYQNDIDMALQKMKELYSVDEFLPPTKTTLKNKGDQ